MVMNSIKLEFEKNLKISVLSRHLQEMMRNEVTPEIKWLSWIFVKIWTKEPENITKAQNTVLKEFHYTGLNVLPLSEHINKQPLLYAWSSACSGYIYASDRYSTNLANLAKGQ